MEGVHIWGLKDRIDRAWMDGYRGAGVRQAMGMMGVGDGVAWGLAADMRCGGCGSKISGTVGASIHGLLPVSLDHL